MRKTVFVSIVFIVLCGMVAACRSYIPQAATTQRDSLVIREVVRDTVVSLQPDSSLVRALLECDSLGQVHIKELTAYKSGQRLRPPDLSVKDNVLTATSYLDSLSIFLQLWDRYTEAYHDQEKVQVVEVNRLTWWQKMWVGWGKIAAGLGAAGIGYKLIKRKLF